jgi:hypothetical protein
MVVTIGALDGVAGRNGLPRATTSK